MLKAAAIGAAATWAFALADQKIGIVAKLPATVQQFAWVLPGAIAGIAVKKFA